ncbi:hypothetical protein [Deinococcus apachensis]|uniref:hypothetical protein n=1 Tax=Deinococcus apachensis TaxID=309886 RepID=UPI0012FBF2EC|nr:hypothetical protein [Deinococcus apachensis]
MNRNLITGLPLSVCLIASSALAGGPWRAWSDQTRLPAFAEHKDQVAKTRDSACKPRVRDYATPGLPVGGGQNIDELIRQLEEMLARMKPTDQGYAGVAQSLKALREQKEKGTPPLPVGSAPGAVTFQLALPRVEKVLGPEASKAKAPASGDDVISAVAGKNPKLALALLLAPHRAAPKGTWPLVNAAGVLSLSGFPHEAIAFLDEAAPLGGTLPAPAGVPGAAPSPCPTAGTPSWAWGAGRRPRRRCGPLRSSRPTSRRCTRTSRRPCCARGSSTRPPANCAWACAARRTSRRAGTTRCRRRRPDATARGSSPLRTRRRAAPPGTSSTCPAARPSTSRHSSRPRSGRKPPRCTTSTWTSNRPGTRSCGR